MEASTQQNHPQPPAPGLEEQPIDLRKYVEIVLKRKWIILLVFVTAVAVTAIFTMRQPKIYSASTSLVIESSAPAVLGEQVREAVDLGTGSYWFSKEFYETQYKIIKSRQIAERVVEALGLNHDFKFLGIDKLPPELQAKALEKADAAGIVQGMIIVQPVKDSRIVNITIEDTDPERAAILANTVANSYKDNNLNRRTEASKDSADWLQDQLADLRTKLAGSELALFNFKRENDLVYTTLDNKQTITNAKLVAINDTLTKIRTRKAELDAKVKGIKAARDSSDLGRVMALGVIASNSFVNKLKEQQATVQNELAELNERYGPEHPKMKSTLEKLEASKKNLQNEIDAILGANLSEYDELVTTEKNLEVMLEGIKKEAFETNKKEIDYKRLAREEENNQRLFDLVLKRMKEMDLSAMLKANNVRILDEAQVIRLPVKPRVHRNIGIAAVLGLLAGIGFAFLIEIQDRTVKSHQDIEALGLNFLGLLPSIPGGDPAHPAKRDLFINDQPKSTVAECCRTIRTNLLFMSPDNPAKRLVVTSAGPQEGKTTTLINMGIVLAQGGQRVLLVDSDMRRPRLHKSFGVPNAVGLSSLIVGESALDEAIKSTTVPGLFVLPSGPVPPNPAELLHTERFKKLVERLGEKFDRVMFDSPPVGAVTDPLVLANQMDGTILVAKMLRTDRDMAERAAKSLRDANAKILGAILNDVDIEKRQYGYYLGYYYSYGRYYGEGKGRA
jgi:capsular exopolysaccharide synthesis family protein